MNVTKLWNNLGVIVSDYDIRFPHHESVHELKSILLNAKLMVIKNQNVDNDSYIRFMKRLGEMVIHPAIQFREKSHPELLRISNLYQYNQPTGIHTGGCYWHSDLTYSFHQYHITGMLVRSTPLKGTSTLFADSSFQIHDILNRMPDLRFKTIRHKFGNRKSTYRPNSYQAPILSEERCNDSVNHPLLLRHKLTGKIGFHGVSGTSYKIEGLDDQYSVEILDEIEDHILNAFNVHRYDYEPDDLVLWDNAMLIHCGVPLESTEDAFDCRILLRTNVKY